MINPDFATILNGTSIQSFPCKLYSVDLAKSFEYVNLIALALVLTVSFNLITAGIIIFVPSCIPNL